MNEYDVEPNHQIAKLSIFSQSLPTLQAFGKKIIITTYYKQKMKVISMVVKYMTNVYLRQVESIMC